MVIDSGCRLAENRKMRFLQGAEELRIEIAEVGLGHVQRGSVFEMAMQKSDEIKVCGKVMKLKYGLGTINYW